MLERIDHQKTTSSRSEKRFNYPSSTISLITPKIPYAKQNSKTAGRKPPWQTPIQSGLAPYHHPSSIPNRNVREMLPRHQRDRNYKRQGPSMTDKQERQEAVIAETWRRSPPRSKQYLARDPACARDLAIRSLRRTGGRVLPRGNNRVRGSFDWKHR
jgi:hypothetical protein